MITLAIEYGVYHFVEYSIQSRVYGVDNPASSRRLPTYKVGGRNVSYISYERTRTLQLTRELGTKTAQELR